MLQTDIETRRLLASIVESSDDAIVTKDLNGVVTSWNTAAERIFGYSAAEMIGQPIARLAPADRVDEIPEILRLIKQGRRVDHYETIRRTKEGRLLNVSVTISPLRDVHGEVVGASKIARDITGRRLSEQQFAYVTAHDLQEPLRGISTMSELLQRRYRGQLDVGADEVIAHIVKSADRMGSLIQDLLRYASIADESGIRFTTVAMTAAVESAWQNLHRAWQESGAELEVTRLPEVRGDLINLVQLFQNLIGNAIKYRGSQAPRVSISAARVNREWLFSVADNGIGIAPAYHQTIFGLCTRLHGVKYPGSGVGLAFCRRIVERHGGRIWVESGLGEGATFKFTLPKAS